MREIGGILTWVAGDDRRLQRVQNLAKRVDFFGFERGVVADVEAVEVDMFDFLYFLTEQSAEVGLAELVGDISDFQATSTSTSG